jgi:hypothetical protein
MICYSDNLTNFPVFIALMLSIGAIAAYAQQTPKGKHVEFRLENNETCTYDIIYHKRSYH